MKVKTYEQRLKRELMIFFAFFIVTLIGFVFSIKYPALQSYALILLTFMIFNGISLIINLIIKSTRTIVNGGE